MSKKAFAYYRTSSAANVGGDKDSLARQESAVRAAATHGVEIVEAFHDAAISGADAIDARPGFQDMLTAIAGNGVRTVLVETANRFARDLIVQETGYRFLQAQGIELVAVDSPMMFLDDTPTAALIRQILGAVAQFEKAALVSRLAAAQAARQAGRQAIAYQDEARARVARPAITRQRSELDLTRAGLVLGGGRLCDAKRQALWAERNRSHPRSGLKKNPETDDLLRGSLRKNRSQLPRRPALVSALASLK
jgi:DNA invertase Pin-like site-specific DNA recombinase